MGWTLEPARWLAAGALGLAYAGLCLWFGRQAGRRGRLPSGLAATDERVWTVVYASQTGLAESLAGQAVAALQQAAASVQCCGLDQLDVERLTAGGRFLFVVSTAGQGDAPDNGARFAASVLSQDVDLRGVDFGLLALGDSDYSQFCGFGRRLEAWLVNHGARRCIDRVEVDRGDPAAISCWQARLAEVAGAGEFTALGNDDFLPWRLVDRRHLNPGSQGGEVFHLAFEPVSGELPAWESGDLAQIIVPGASGRPRDYSIASLPAEGRLHLLVRLHRKADNSVGRMSGWLTQVLVPGGEVALRLRQHAAFRLNGNQGRPAVFIGNGVGLAGLRGHLSARITAGLSENWLLFGERSEACDFHYRGELESWRDSGLLKRLDTAFSRDGRAYRYVQDCLAANDEAFRDWVGRGAAIYVCGSRLGMAEEVEQTVRQLLGDQVFQHLLREGRYCRDVF